MKIRFLLSSFLAFSPFLLSGQSFDPTCFSFSTDDYPQDAVVASTGNYIVVGSGDYGGVDGLGQVFVLSTSPDGELIWSFYLNKNYPLRLQVEEFGGGFIVSGIEYDFSVGFYPIPFVFLVAANGDLLWEKEFPAADPVTGNIADNIVIDEMAGVAYFQINHTVVGFDADGNQVEEFGIEPAVGSFTDYFYRDPTGNWYLTDDALLYKFNPNFEFQEYYELTADFYNLYYPSYYTDPQGNFLTVAQEVVFPSQDAYWKVIGYDLSGNLLFNERLDVPYSKYSYVHGITQVPGGYVVAGATRRVEDLQLKYFPCLAKIDQGGALKWHHELGFSSWEHACTEIFHTGGTTFWLAGQRVCDPDDGYDIYFGEAKVPDSVAVSTTNQFGINPNRLEVFPNPARQTAPTLRYKTSSPSPIFQVYDQRGGLVREISATASNGETALGSLPAGLYVVKYQPNAQPSQAVRFTVLGSNQ